MSHLKQCNNSFSKRNRFSHFPKCSFIHFWRENSNFLNKITVFLNHKKCLIYKIAIIHLQGEIHFWIFQSTFAHFWRENSNFFKQYHSVLKSRKMSHLQHCNSCTSKDKRFSAFSKCIVPIFGPELPTF